MYTAHCPLDIEACVNPVGSSLILTARFNRFKWDKLPTFLTATKQPLSLNGLIMLSLHLGNLYKQILVGIAPHLAANILLVTEFIDRFIRGIFTSEHKVVSWRSTSFAITNRPRLLKIDHKPQHVLGSSVTPAHFQVQDDLIYDAVLVAKQIVLKPYAQHHVLVNTNYYGILTI